MKKLIILTLALNALASFSIKATKRPAIVQLTPELIKKPKLNHSSKNTIKTTDSLLNSIEDKKIVEIIKKYVSCRPNTINFLPPITFKNDDQVWIYEALKSKDYKKAAEIIDNNIDKDGYTPLIKAVRNNDIESVKFFIKLGVNLDKQDQNIEYFEDHEENEEYELTNTTALIHAIKLNQKEIVKLLVSSGADLNIQDSLLGTPLIWAVYYNNLDIVKILLNSNSDLNLEAKSCLSLSDEGQALDYIPTNTAINHAVFDEYPNNNIIRELVKSGASLSNKDSFVYQPIFHSYRNYNTAIELIQANADLISENINNIIIKDRIRLLFLLTEKLEEENLTVEKFKDIDAFESQRGIVPTLTENSKIKLILSKRLATKFMQKGNLSDYCKNLLSCLNIEEKIEVTNYILDKNYKRINLDLNRLIELKNLLLGENYNFDAISKLQDLTDNREDTKKLITTYSNKIQDLQEIIRKRAYISTILSGPRVKTDIPTEIASNISSYLNLKDLRNIK